MNAVGYDILKKRYSASVGDDPTGFLRFIQNQYLWKLERTSEFQRATNKIFEKTTNQYERELNIIQRVVPLTVYGVMFAPQPFYEESLELARFIVANVPNFHFHSRPYVRTPKGSYENAYYVAYSVIRMQMPELTKKEMEMAKQEAYARATYGDKFNVYHYVQGSCVEAGIGGNLKSRLLVCCCHMPGELAKLYCKDDSPKEIEYMI